MTPRKAPVGIVRADAPSTNATPSHAPMALAGISSPSGQASPSANQAAAPSAAPARIDVPNPPTTRVASGGAIARSGARDGLDDIGRGRDGTVRRPRTGDEHWFAAVAHGESRRHEPVEQRVRPLG